MFLIQITERVRSFQFHGCLKVLCETPSNNNDKEVQFKLGQVKPAVLVYNNNAKTFESNLISVLLNRT